MSDKPKYIAYKQHSGDKVWWVEKPGVAGEYLVSFDKKKIYNLFRDYPDKFSVEDWIQFNVENPYWMGFFSSRNVFYVAEHIEELERLGREDIISYWKDKGISLE